MSGNILPNNTSNYGSPAKRPNSVGGNLTAPNNPTAGGGSASVAGVHITHKFPFAFDTPNLLTGATAVFTDGYTPAVDDVLWDVFLSIRTAWNGTTPLGDVGNFIAPNPTFGWFALLGPLPLLMTVADVQGVYGLLSQHANSQPINDLQWTGNLNTSPLSNTTRQIPAPFASADPIKVVVSQDGTTTGADPGSTTGSAVLYVVTSTPA